MAALAPPDGSGVFDQDYLVESHFEPCPADVGQLRFCRRHPPTVSVLGPGQSEPQAEIELRRPVLLGRCGQADLQVHDTWVSRRHCEFVAVDDGLLVRDVGSKHGTFVNDEPITQKTLRHGDELNVGLLRFSVSYED